ncbi:TonB family protein [Thioflavicoccus mobilis 8321]|uniref:Protein TonB n=1 Tax=Thioflavicoccus mobilis 8321 TaxID=765912 RepID=L0H1Q9_9GAMM|nr:energy transducer TonB [Thioflavicoccus mobilis]AGA91509.1 TonB family protein [Thioflavicoccus mobilis 8321]
MTDGGTFSRGQWALAAGVALALHGLLAWAWLAATPPLAPASGGHGGLRVGTLSLGAAEAPRVTAVAAEAPTRAVPRPTATQTMAEVAPPPRQTEAEAVRPPRPEPPPRAPSQRPPQRTSERPTERTSTAQPRDDKGGHAGGDSGREGAVGADHEARPLPDNPRPVYPLLARRQGIEGRVLIRVAVLDSGRVGRAEVSRGSGARALDNAALAAVRRWRFHPALRNGQAIAATITVPVIFRLED